MDSKGMYLIVARIQNAQNIKKPIKPPIKNEINCSRIIKAAKSASFHHERVSNKTPAILIYKIVNVAANKA